MDLINASSQPLITVDSNYLEQFINFIDASPNTIRTYKASLKQWFNYTSAQNITRPTPQNVKAYRDYLLASGRRPTTVQSYLMAVKQFFKWTEEMGYYRDIAKNVKGLKLGTGHKKDYLTSKQAAAILRNIERKTLKGKRDYAMLSLMLTMALRTIEVSRANIEDMRISGEVTVLYVQGKGHIEKDAPVRMPEHVEEALRDYLRLRRELKSSAPLFASTSNNNLGKRLSTRSIRGIVKQCFINAGYNSPRLTAHSTRHTSATLNLLNGATLEETQQLLRHTNIQTTEIYAHHLNSLNNKSSDRISDAIFK